MKSDGYPERCLLSPTRLSQVNKVDEATQGERVERHLRTPKQRDPGKNREKAWSSMMRLNKKCMMRTSKSVQRWKRLWRKLEGLSTFSNVKSLLVEEKALPWALCFPRVRKTLELGEEVDETGEVERPLEEVGPQGPLTSSKERFYQRKDKKGLVQPYQDRQGATWELQWSRGECEHISRVYQVKGQGDWDPLQRAMKGTSHGQAGKTGVQESLAQVTETWPWEFKNQGTSQSNRDSRKML